MSEYFFLGHFMAKVGVPLGGPCNPVSLTFSSILYCIYVRVYVPLGAKTEWVSEHPTYSLMPISVYWMILFLCFFRHLFVCVLPCSLNSMMIRLQTQAVLPILCFSLRWSLFDNIPDHCSV